MSDPRVYLKPMLMDLINGNQEAAEQTVHNYLVAKTQQITGMFGNTAPEEGADAVIDELDAE